MVCELDHSEPRQLIGDDLLVTSKNQNLPDQSILNKKLRYRLVLKTVTEAFSFPIHSATDGTRRDHNMGKKKLDDLHLNKFKPYLTKKVELFQAVSIKNHLNMYGPAG